MDMDSDSDDDILPNLASMTSLFSSVQKQVRKETPVTLPIPSKKAPETPRKSDSPKSERKSLFKNKSKTDGTKLPSPTDSKNLNGSLEPPSSKLSDDTEKLLAQAESLKLPIITSPSGAPISARKNKLVESPEELEAVSFRTRNGKSRPKRSKTSKRGAKKEEKVPVPIPVVSLDDEMDYDGVPTQEILVDEIEELNFSQSSQISDMDVAPVEELSTVRIQWKEEIMRFNFPIGTKLSHVRMEVGQKISMRADDLILISENTYDEVPDSLLVKDLPFGITLVVSEKVKETDPKKLGPNYIQVKVQGCGGYRERLTVAIQKTTHISQLIDDYVKKFGLQEKKFKLIFDGDTVDLAETAESLDLDGGEMFDIVEII